METADQRSMPGKVSGGYLAEEMFVFFYLDG